MKQAEVNMRAAYLLGRSGRISGDKVELALSLGCVPYQAETALAEIMELGLTVLTDIGVEPKLLLDRLAHPGYGKGST